MNTTASSDEKILAALAHGSVFLMFLGPVVPAIVWASQRKKSKYVSFHALQAMGYQAFYFWLGIVVWVLAMFLFICLIPVFVSFIKNSGDTALVPFLFQIPVFLIVFGFLGLFFILGIVGAVSCLLGHDFRYPLLGTWLERYLGYDITPESQMIETQEDNWVAGICHATAILQLWGVVTPLIVWFSQKERSARLRFQSMQAFLYQVIAFIMYMLGMGVYMAFLMGMFITMLTGGTTGGGNELQGLSAFMMTGFLIVMMVFVVIVMIGMPIYYLLAGIAGFRVIRGHHFRYPFLGKIIEKRLNTSQSLEPVS
jgi:uncharacterized Tic20 family protein